MRLLNAAAPVAAILLAVAAWSPKAVLAQGVVEDGPCQFGAQGPDGQGGDNTDQFVYRSWSVESEQRDSRVFHRCIQNQARKSIWTDWRGLLSATWIPEKHRLNGATRISNGREEPKGTVLWWGDAKDKRVRPQAKCYQGEDACLHSGGTSRAPGSSPISLVAFDMTKDIELSVKEKRDIEVATYQEFYLPEEVGKPKASLARFAIEVRSQLVQGQLTYQFNLYAAPVVQAWGPRSEPVFMFSLDSTVSRAFSLQNTNVSQDVLKEIATKREPRALSLELRRIAPRAMAVSQGMISILSSRKEVMAVVPVSLLLPQ
jgi:hypothetical protein